MSLRGACSCGNIQLTWHTVDHSLVPRACQCGYCLSRKGEYVSKSGTRVEARIANPRQHHEHRQGSGAAVFHECAHCGDLVFVTAEIDGELYGALNAHALDNKRGFPPAVKLDYDGQSAQEKTARWRDNWCSPVQIRIPAGD